MGSTKYSQALEPVGEGEYGYGLEVFHYAYPEEPLRRYERSTLVIYQHNGFR